MAKTHRVIIKDRGLKNLKKQLKVFDNTAAKIGLFGSGDDPETNVAARGAAHVAPGPKSHNPKRDFMSLAVKKNENEIEKTVQKLYKAVTKGSIQARKAVKILGVMHEDQIKNAILTGPFVANKPATIAKKKSSRPLIDRSDMKNSVKNILVRMRIM